jgi:hypothetical protein
MPDELIELFLDADRENEIVLLTAFGRSDEILGEQGRFEALRGFAQGGSDSPHG